MMWNNSAGPKNSQGHPRAQIDFGTEGRHRDPRRLFGGSKDRKINTALVRENSTVFRASIIIQKPDIFHHTLK